MSLAQSNRDDVGISNGTQPGESLTHALFDFYSNLSAGPQRISDQQFVNHLKEVGKSFLLMSEKKTFSFEKSENVRKYAEKTVLLGKTFLAGGRSVQSDQKMATFLYHFILYLSPTFFQPKAENSPQINESNTKEKVERERLEKEKLEKERTEKERIEKERIEKEKERLEKERLEKERLEKERLEKERSEKEKFEKQRFERESLEKQRLEKERLEKERLEKERLEKERLEKEKLEKQKLEKERLEKEREKLQKEISKKEQIQRDRIEREIQVRERGPESTLVRENTFYDPRDRSESVVVHEKEQRVSKQLIGRWKATITKNNYPHGDTDTSSTVSSAYEKPYPNTPLAASVEQGGGWQKAPNSPFDLSRSEDFQNPHFKKETNNNNNYINLRSTSQVSDIKKVNPTTTKLAPEEIIDTPQKLKNYVKQIFPSNEVYLTPIPERVSIIAHKRMKNLIFDKNEIVAMLNHNIGDQYIIFTMDSLVFQSIDEQLPKATRWDQISTKNIKVERMGIAYYHAFKLKNETINFEASPAFKTALIQLIHRMALSKDSVRQSKQRTSFLGNSTRPLVVQNSNYEVQQIVAIELKISFPKDYPFVFKTIRFLTHIPVKECVRQIIDTLGLSCSPTDMGLCLKSQKIWLEDNAKLSSYKGLLYLGQVDFERKPPELIKTAAFRERSKLPPRPDSTLQLVENDQDNLLKKMTNQELISIIRQERNIKEQLELELQKKETYIKLQQRKINELQTKLSSGAHVSEVPPYDTEEAENAATNLLNDIDDIFGDSSTWKI